MLPSKTILAPLFIAFGGGMVFFPFFIRWQKSWGVGQKIKKEGPNLHLHKENTPTMGGLIIIMSSFLGLWFGGGLDRLTGVIFLFLLLFFALGFWDDYQKSVLGRPWGIKARYKFFAQLLGSAGLLLWGFRFFPHHFTIPFTNYSVELGVVEFLLYGVLVMVASMNAFNIVDGLDGLAAGCGLLTFAFWSIILGTQNRLALVGLSEAAIGALLAFLWFNFWPARIFMGDSGSLPLGALMGILSLASGHSLLLVLAGVIFVVDTLSVVLQVISFKIRKKRLFLMSPLHHHFELRGVKESHVTIRFWIVQILGVLVALGSVRG